MQTKKLFYSSSSLVISVTMVVWVLTFLNNPPLSVKANALLKEPVYVESYDVQGESIIITRNRVMPGQIQAAYAGTLTAPVLLEPSDGAILSTLCPRFVWEQASPEVFRYIFQLSRSSDFSIVDEETYYDISNPSPGSPAYYFTFSNLLPDTIYYWHVGIAYGGSFSSVFWFRTAPAGGVILPAPNLLAPVDGATTGSTRITFSLEPVDSAVRYQYRYYHEQAAGWDDWYRAALTQSPLRQATFNPQETFYWRAAAANSYAFGTPSAMKSFITPPVTAETTISPESGATLTPDPGNISVQFPPGAVAQPTTLSYTLQPVTDHDLANFRFGGRAFTLVASDSNGNVTTFNQPFTLTIIYDSWDLIAADISDPSRLNLVFWDGSKWQEILPCAGCSIDTGNRTVTVVINHLSEFALVGPDQNIIYLPITMK